ncbi:PAS domain S-box protein [Aquamicrobium ahrensii]|uniref:histidine kinase n=1 Tax=Aquamicrobium ahrensii TaxID=469551 RepID=A0ABV2KKW4_9HYPH
MSPETYSFLDVAVLDTVRRRFAAGDAMVILSADLDRVLWANGPGAALFGYGDVDAAIGAEARLPPVARRQIGATSGYPDIGVDRPLLVRLTAGISGETTALLASGLAMPDREKAILFVAPVAAGDKTALTPDPRALGGFDEDAQFLAFIDGEGNVEASSTGFADLAIPGETLAALVRDVAGENERTVKRLIRVGNRSCPAGIARLTDEPVRHLLVVIDEGSPASEPAATPRPHGASHHGETGGRHDHWYFAHDDGPAPAEPVSPSPAASGVKDSPQAEAAPVRFVWRTDAEGRFSVLSEEFAAAVGAPAADVIGRRFREVAAAFAFDPAGEVGDLLERRDTWSGRSVMWPLAGAALSVPVDLAALPVYNRDREFEGFRGFGVIRMGEARPDPERIGLALTPNGSKPVGTPQRQAQSPADPFNGEVPALSISPQPERRVSDKIIRLAEHRPPVTEPPARERGLSTTERNAFREIAERLRKESSTDTQKREDKQTGPAQKTQDEAAHAARPVATEPERPARGSLLDYAPDPDDDSMAEADFRDARLDGDEFEAASGETVAFNTDDHAGSIETDEPQTASLAQGDGASPVSSRTAKAAPDTSILARLPVPLLIHSGDVLHYANDEFLELTGYDTLEELIASGGLDALFVDPFADQPEAGESGPDEARHALFLRRRDGSEFPVEAILRSVRWQDRTALLLVVRRSGEDLGRPEAPAIPAAASSATQADVAELKARIGEMRTIIDTATDGVVLIGRDGAIRSISRPAEALFGFDSDDVTGKPFASLFAIESQRAARDYLAGLSEPGVASVLNDGREVIGREAQGRFIPLFMTIGRLPNDSGFCAVVRDITQWKRAEEDLTQARALAERASSQKSDFLARISHEIRTPLNAIIGFSELMMDEKFGPVANDRYRDYLRDINRSGSHVLDLVNDLLDISKIEAGQQEMDYEAVSLNDTLAETVALMQPQANRERVIIRSSFASKLPDVVADLRSVRQIALNILSNAIRYTQAGGQVIVSTAYEPSGDVVMRVRDTGIGMTQAEIEQALKPFKQVNALKRGRSDGTGLGLPLTKAMVEANRARFTITSTPGEGTLVEIAFPSVRVLAG